MNKSPAASFANPSPISLKASLDLSNSEGLLSLEASQSPTLDPEGAGMDRSPQLVGVCLAGLSFLLTMLSFAALLGSRGPLPANLRLVLSLITSDALTCSAVALKLAYELVATADMSACYELLSSSLRMTAHAATLLNLTLLAVDVFLAIKVRSKVLLKPRASGDRMLLLRLLLRSFLRLFVCSSIV